MDQARGTARLSPTDPAAISNPGSFGKHDFKNFELKVDVMTLPGANGGVYFHIAYHEQGGRPRGLRRPSGPSRMTGWGQGLR